MYSAGGRRRAYLQGRWRAPAAVLATVCRGVGGRRRRWWRRCVGGVGGCRRCAVASEGAGGGGGVGGRWRRWWRRRAPAVVVASEGGGVGDGGRASVPLKACSGTITPSSSLSGSRWRRQGRHARLYSPGPLVPIRRPGTKGPFWTVFKVCTRRDFRFTDRD
jgi:hypothetical protein